VTVAPLKYIATEVIRVFSRRRTNFAEKFREVRHNRGRIV